MVGEAPALLAFAMFSAFSERRRISDKLIESLLPREVSSRLATLLVNLGERFSEEFSLNSPIFDVPEPNVGSSAGL